MSQQVHPNQPMSPPPFPVSPGRAPVARKPRSLFATGFIVTMGVMVAVTAWAVAWGLATGLIITVLAAVGSA
jgi:hypothetical protein